MLPIQTILLPTDFSEPSAFALRFASALASDYGASLVIVHVVAAPMVPPNGVLFSNADQGEAERGVKRDHPEGADGRIEIVHQREEENPADEILNLAQLCHADLIVMGSHRRRGMSRWIKGRVAEAVLRTATCPVLIVTSPDSPPR